MKTYVKYDETKSSYSKLKTDDKELLDIITNSFKMLYEKDKYLINNKPYPENTDQNTYVEIGKLHHVGERSIVFRFGYYLQKQLEKSTYKNYNVDCEYNRNGENAKKLNEEHEKGVYPDIIIHTRSINDNNLLVMEFKTYWNKDTSKDKEKIEALMSPDKPYKYKYGMSVVIDTEYASVETVDQCPSL